MRMNNPQTGFQKSKKSLKGILLKSKSKNIPKRLDMRMWICYTIGVAGTCVQAFGTPVVWRQTWFEGIREPLRILRTERSTITQVI